MQEIVDKEKCSGCHACYSICHKKCITMVADNEGFLYPKIDSNLCVDCGLCKKVCPVMSEYKGNSIGKAYACINNDTDVRLKSSSGGVFTLIAENILDKGGVVFGVSYDEYLNVHHIEITEKKELEMLRGSKYLQSRIEDTYKKAKEYLNDGRWVLWLQGPEALASAKFQTIKAEDLGKPIFSECSFDDCDGNPLDLSMDYSGNKRYERSAPGAFSSISPGLNKITVWQAHQSE